MVRGRVGHRNGLGGGGKRTRDGKKQSNGRQVEKRRGWRSEWRDEVRKEEKIREVEQRWRGNRLSCSPGKGDLFVSVGLCYSPDVSIIGL